MDNSEIKVLRNVLVPRTLQKDFIIPELAGIDLGKVVLVASNGLSLGIERITHIKYTVLFTGQSPLSVIDIVIKFKSAAQEVEIVPEEEPKPEPEPELEPVDELVPVPSLRKSLWRRKIKNPLAVIQQKQAERILNRKEIIKKRDALDVRGLRNKRVLTFDQPCCWARSLGMIAIARQLQYQIDMPLYNYYNRITGQGYGAIIAAAIAARISFDDLVNWWVTDWRQAHKRSTLYGIKRRIVKIINPNEAGFDHKAAVNALKKLFLRGKSPLRMRDVGPELQITVIQADFAISVHDSTRHPDMALWEVVEDSAITRDYYNSKKTIKGEAILLGAVEKNDVMGLALAKDNTGLQLTSIGVPMRIPDPVHAKKLDKLGQGGFRVTGRGAGYFVYEKRVDQLIEKLRHEGCEIDYLRIECRPMENILLNSTTDEALQLGRESGSGEILLPEWFRKTIHKHIA